MATTAGRPLSAALPRLATRTTGKSSQQSERAERVLNPSDSSVFHPEKSVSTVAHANPSSQHPLVTADLGFFDDAANRRVTELAEYTPERNPNELEDEGEKRTPLKVYGS